MSENPSSQDPTSTGAPKTPPGTPPPGSPPPGSPLADPSPKGAASAKAPFDPNEMWGPFFENSSDCIKLLDPNGRLLSTNKVGMAVLGLKTDCGFDMEWLGLLPHTVRDPGKKALATAATGRNIRFFGQSLDDEGVRRYWDNSLTPILDGRHVKTILCVSRDVTDQFRSYNEVRAASETDELTGLSNRGSIMREMRELTSLSRDSFGVLVIDVDDLKLINDNRGHLAGDAALAFVAHSIRASMPVGFGSAGRVGGDEFVMIARDVGTRAELGAIADDLCNTVLAGSYPTGDPDVAAGVSVTVGGSLFPRDAHGAEGLIAAADARLKRQKRSRKGTMRLVGERRVV